MHHEQLSWSPEGGWRGGDPARRDAGLVLYFGGRDALADGARHRELQAAFPAALLLGCSTGGQILGDTIDDDGVVALAVGFRATRLRLASDWNRDPGRSVACGEALGRTLIAGSSEAETLAGVFVLSDGLHVNGSGLVAGLRSVLGDRVPLTGGLAGDGARFGTTLVGAGEHPPQEGLVAAIGFYGDAIRIGHGSAGGWDAFGPYRRVTPSAGNLLRELDGEPALDLYERYLGEEAAGLPGTALLYPLRIWDPARPDHDMVRTVLGVDRDARTMTFAGDVPQGWVGQLMHGSFDHLTAGAAEAAAQASTQAAATSDGGDRLAILVSCIGRRLLMGQSIQDEIEAVAGRLPDDTVRIGFYSYGEISPHALSGACELHNQTMTVTLLAEAG